MKKNLAFLNCELFRAESKIRIQNLLVAIGTYHEITKDMDVPGNNWRNFTFWADNGLKDCK